MKFTRWLLAASLLSTALSMALPALAQSPRPDIELTGNWKFIKQDVAQNADTSTWETVAVPHTWNAIDGQNGRAANPQYKSGYYRGPAWYARPLQVPTDWKGKRVFLRFEAASLVADTYVNNQKVGQHRGGFEAFCYDITPFLHFDGQDALRVRVDNTRVEDVPPLSGDFTVFGGIYRPVHLFATDPVCVTPLDFASSGVYLKTQSITESAATVQAKALVSNGTTEQNKVRVETQIKDANGKVVATQSDNITLVPSATSTVLQSLTIKRPHLWQGRKDPYLYSATVRVRRGKNWVDQVVQPLGLRTIALTNDKGFLLNGQPYPIHGVNRHQERQDKGWALSNADHDEDHKIILDMGATAIRLAHYPQSEYFHSLCDHSGLLLWEEIPQVNELRSTPEFVANAQQQLREMISQHYNDPSVAFWGISNELNPTWSSDATPYLQQLRTTAHEMDGSRPVVCAVAGNSRAPYMQALDWIGYNTYPGWYGGTPEGMTKTIEDVAANYGKRIGISEYGAGGNPRQHEEGDLKTVNQGGQFHPEEYQTYVHQRDWAQMKDNPHLWGTFIWAMFDFAVDGRNEGGVPGQNDKGMVTHDRKIKKDVYYFYKANWNDEPMTYIASRRMTPRVQPTSQVKVFSNCSTVELKVNGKSLGVVQPDDVHVFRWENVQLQVGTNHIEAIGKSNGKDVKDECDWDLQPPSPTMDLPLPPTETAPAKKP